MPKFRKKPVVIEATELTADRILAYLRDKKPLPFGVMLEDAEWHPDYGVRRFRGSVKTANGTVIVGVGDWICQQEIDGKPDVWPCKPDIFAATYEPAPDAQPAPEGK